MNKLLTKTKEFIFAQQTSMFSSTILISGMIILSKIAGLIRDRVFTHYYSTEILDIYLASFRIPDLIFEILITGALSTTFIPYFIKFQKKPEEHSQIISSIINIISLILVAVTIVLTLLLPIIVPLITPGFSQDKIEQIIFYSRILLIGQLPFLIFGNFLTGISQAKKSFLIPALAPILYQLSIVISTVLFSQQLHLLAPIYGVVTGAVLFFLVQVPILYTANFRYQMVITHLKTVWKFFRTALPRIFTIIVSQIEATIDLTLTTLLGSGAYTIFFFAQKLQFLPISVIGIAFGQASLPYLSEMYEEKKFNEFKAIVVNSILNMFYLTIPIASFLVFSRTPIIRLIYGGDKFDWNATVLTAITMSYFAISIPFHSIYYFLTRCFYATFDTRTPFKVSVLSVAINASLSLSFILLFKFPIWSMALAFSFSISLSVILLAIILYKKIGGFDIKFILFETSKIIVASFNASIVTYGCMRLFDGLIFDTTRTINVFLLLLTCAVIYISLYFFLTWLFGIREMYVITKMILKMREYQRKFAEVYKGVE